MSSNQQRRLPRIVRPKMGGDVISDGNQGMQFLTGDNCSHITVPSYKPRLAIPHIGDGWLTYTTAVRPPTPRARGQVILTHCAMMPAAAQQQLAGKQPPATRNGFTYLPVLPAVGRQDCGDRQKKDRASPVPLSLLQAQAEYKQKSSRPRHKVVLQPTADLNTNIKLPEIARAPQAKRVRPKSGEEQRKSQLTVLPPIPVRGGVVINKNFQKEMDAPLEKAQRAEGPKKAELKKKKRV